MMRSPARGCWRRLTAARFSKRLLAEIADFGHNAPSPRGAAATTPRSTMATTHVNERRYVTWRLPDRQFSKVHLQRDPEATVCGKTLPRATGSPQPPIPAAAMCPECAASEA
jgi:hypothetical protein